MGKYKQDYVDGTPFIGFTSNAKQIQNMGVAAIPATVTDDSYTLNMPFSQIVALMRNNICVAAFESPTHGIQNDVIAYANYQAFTVFTLSGAELVAADADSYPTNAS